MFQLIYTDKENNQYFLNIETEEIAKINRTDLNSLMNKSRYFLMLFGFINLFMIFYRRIIIDFKINKIFLLISVFICASLLGSTLYYLSKKNQKKELENHLIDYSVKDVRKWIEDGKWDRSVLVRISLVLCGISLLVSYVFLMNQKNILSLLVIFVSWMLGSYLFCEPILYSMIYKNKFEMFCIKNNIVY